MSKPSDLVQGTLDLLLLKILALEPLHGWAISQRLKQVSSDVLQVSDGSLYPSLHKLEQEGWIAAEWKTSELGRRGEFYSPAPPRRKRPPHADTARPETARQGDRRLGAPLYRDHAHRAAEGGLTRMAWRWTYQMRLRLR